MAVQNTLPDPNIRINDAGQDTSGSYGPGFSSVTVTSQQPVVMNRSNSGLAFRSINKYQKFMVDIKYNSLTKAEFDIVYPFLLQRQASLEAFFVELPQYGNTSAGTKEVSSTAEAGAVSIALNNVTNINVGDMFFVTDPNDDTHVKTYKVTKISSTTLQITPPLQRKIDTTKAGTEQVSFGTPRMRVVVPGSDIQYSINAQGLYTFSVKLEETLS